LVGAVCIFIEEFKKRRIQEKKNSRKEEFKKRRIQESEK